MKEKRIVDTFYALSSSIEYFKEKGEKEIEERVRRRYLEYTRYKAWRLLGKT